MASSVWLVVDWTMLDNKELFDDIKAVERDWIAVQLPNCGRDAGCPAPSAKFRTCPLRHTAPTLNSAVMSADGKSLARPRMSDFQPGRIGVHKGLESGPLEAVLLRATA